MISKDDLAYVSAHAYAAMYLVDRMISGGRSSEAQNRKQLEYIRQRLRDALSLLEGKTVEPTMGE